MLRVTPIYGSRWSDEGQAEEPNCTLIEYASCRVLLNVGWWPTAGASGAGARAGGGGGGGGGANSDQTSSATSLALFPDLPDHDCLVITDSTLQSMGGLPMYYKQMRRKEQKKKMRRKQDATAKQQLQQPSDDDDDDAATDSEMARRRPIIIHATFPTVKMGQMTLYDCHAAICMDGGNPPYSLRDLDDAMAAITCIKYSQAIYMPPQQQQQQQQGVSGIASTTTRGKNATHTNILPRLSITAHRAGHVVGGAFFVLQRLQDETIVVATGTAYNIAKELHLDRAELDKYGSTPDVLVTRPGGPAFRQFKALTHEKQRGIPPALPRKLAVDLQRNLVENVLSVLRRDGNVLIPADAAGRALEVMLLLDGHWQRQRLASTYNLVWLGPMVQNTAEFARSQLEWMSEKLGRDFDKSSSGNYNRGEAPPFHLRATHLLTSVSELNQFLADQVGGGNPTCVVASGLSLDGGPARDVLLQWADNQDNAILFTDSAQCSLRHWNGGGATSSQTTTSSSSGTAAVAGNAMMSGSKTTEALSLEPVVAALPMAGGQDDDDNVAGAGGAVGEEIASSSSSPWTVSAQLLQAWGQAKAAGREMDDSVWIHVPVPHRAPLAGVQLKAFLDAEEDKRLERQQKEEKEAMLREVELAKGRLRLGEEEGTTGTTTASAMAPTTAAGLSNENASKSISAASTTRPRKKSRFDQTLFLKFSKPLHLTFEMREEAVGIGQNDSTAKYGIGESVGRSGEVLEDDYGISVIPEKFTDIVSGVDPSKFGSTGRIGEEVMRRGFGYGVSGGANASTASGRAARVSEDEGSDDDVMDEQALEAEDLSEGNGIIRGRAGRPPTKVTTVIRKVEVLAEVSYAPLEGRVDARVARQSVRSLQPREVIVLGGAATGDSNPELVDEVSLLADAAKSFATGSKDVLTPSDGVTAELNVGHAAYAVRLVNAPYQTREEKEAADTAPAPLEPFEAKLGDCTVSLLDYVATGQKVAADGSIVLAPRANPENDIPSVYLSPGDVLLPDLREEIISKGLKAEYSTGPGFSQLLVNGKVIARKETSTGKITVEGPLCEDYWVVRNVVCGRYVAL